MNGIEPSYGYRSNNKPSVFRDGKVIDLNDLVTQPGIQLVVAYAINNSGMIAGLAVINNEYRAVVIRP